MRDLLGFDLCAPPVTDPLQKVKVAFIETNTDVSIELIEPNGEDSPVKRFLAEGGGLNHLCYTVSDLDATIEHLRSKGCILVSEPKQAAAFEGRRIAFLYTREHQLIELLEEESV